jgi:diacylglycerol kinase family enzyme
LLIFSGDGGFNEALNGLEGDVPIGFLPGGGTSVLPRALGLPADPLEAAKRIADAITAGRTRQISLGRVNGRRFAFGAGVGLDAEAVRRVDEMGRTNEGKRPGDFAFALAVMRVLAQKRGHLEPELELRGYGRAALAFVANGAPYTYAKRIPLAIAPEADFALGLDVVAPVEIRRRSLVRTAYSLLTGHARSGAVLYGHDLDRLEIVCDRPLPLQADGEDLGDVEEAIFEAERGAVSVLA